MKNLKFAVRWVLVRGLVCAVLITIGAIGFSKTTTIEAVNEVEVNTLPEKIEALKLELVERLASECESKGYDENDGIIIFDANNEASIGRWQWQRKSVIHYYKTLYGEDITPKEAVLVALDDARARELTRDVLFNVNDGHDNWYNCSKKLNIAAEIALIERLEN